MSRVIVLTVGAEWRLNQLREDVVICELDFDSPGRDDHVECSLRRIQAFVGKRPCYDMDPVGFVQDSNRPAASLESSWARKLQGVFTDGRNDDEQMDFHTRDFASEYGSGTLIRIECD